MKLIAILSVAPTVACTSVPIPPCAVTNEWGIARASTPESAEQLSESMVAVAPRIVSAVPGIETKPADVRLVAKVGPYKAFEVGGACIERPSGDWIEIKKSDRKEIEEGTLVHELVHLWLGPDWDPLPPMMEDGIANLVQGLLVPACMAEKRISFVVTMCTGIFGAFRVDPSGFPLGRREVSASLSLTIEAEIGGIPEVRKCLAVDPATYESEGGFGRMFEFVSFGSLLASRIGIEGLHGLCLRARKEGVDQVPPDWIIDAAGLRGAGPVIWEIAILEMYGPAEMEELRRHLSWLELQEGKMPPASVSPATERD